MIVRCVQTLSLEQYQQKLGLDREAPQSTTPVEEEDDDAQVRNSSPPYFSAPSLSSGRYPAGTPTRF